MGAKRRVKMTKTKGKWSAAARARAQDRKLRREVDAALALIRRAMDDDQGQMLTLDKIQESIYELHGWDDADVDDENDVEERANLDAPDDSMMDAYSNAKLVT